MKEFLILLGIILLLLFSIWFGYVIFDMVFYSDLSPFWKWMLLR